MPIAEPGPNPNYPDITNDNTPTWNWAPSANVDGDFHHYNVYQDGVKVAEVLTPTYTSAALADGLHVLEVTAVDDLGNESLRSTQGHVFIDTVPPAVPKMGALPAYTRATTLTFTWSTSHGAAKYDFRYSLDGGSLWIDVPGLTVQSYTVDISDVADGVAVQGQARAWDDVSNVSDWSAVVSTIIDRTGPVTVFTAPTADVSTNITSYTWTWSSVDAGCGVVAGYWVKLDSGGAVYQTEPTFTPHILQPGNHTVTVQAVDALGNIEEVPVTSAIVTVVEPVVIRVTPSPETYQINMISTVVLEVAGMIDADFVVSIGDQVLTGDPVHGWRVVRITATEAMSKYYVLLDEEVLQPGQLLINVRAGLLNAQFIFDVLNERSGFGFGRLRPW